MDYEQVLRIDAAAVDALGEPLSRREKASVITSGTAVVAPDPAGGETTEDSPLSETFVLKDRIRSERHALRLSEDGVRVSAIRLPAYVYGRGGSFLCRYSCKRLRAAFSRIVSRQWQRYVPNALAGYGQGIPDSQFAKGRFIGEMYARACYSMFLVSPSGPIAIRAPVRASGILPLSRSLTIQLGSALLTGIEHLLPYTVHRQLLLTSALMGMLDVVLDDAASAGEDAALRVASLLGRGAPAELLPSETTIAALARAARQSETAWQADYWERVLQPAVSNYCRAEALAVEQIPDPTGMGHRWAGIDAAIKGMWYVAGPRMRLQGDPSRFEQSQWNREQQWMADTSLLMQMIDDWVDQDEDRGARLSPAVDGTWTPATAAELYDKTIRDLALLLNASGIQRPVLKVLFVDLYKDYLHAAMDAMRSGLAA